MILLKRKKAFTLLELMLALSLMGIVSIGVYKLSANGYYMYHYGQARLELDNDMRTLMMILKKTIQLSQGSSIQISRFDTEAPANSYLSSVLGETIYITSNRQKCRLGISADPEVLGSNGQPMEIYQYKNYIRMVVPKVKPGTDMTDAALIQANTYYETITVTSNAEDLAFAFTDSKDGAQVTASVRLSKWVMDQHAPIVLYRKESVTVKRTHAAGYYYD